MAEVRDGDYQSEWIFPIARRSARNESTRISGSAPPKNWQNHYYCLSMTARAGFATATNAASVRQLQGLTWLQVEAPPTGRTQLSSHLREVVSPRADGPESLRTAMTTCVALPRRPRSGKRTVRRANVAGPPRDPNMFLAPGWIRIQASHDLVECFLSLCRRRKFRLQLDDYCCEGPSANEQFAIRPSFC